MTTRILRTILVFALLLVVSISAFPASTLAVERERDSLAPVTDMAAPAYQAAPPDIFQPVQVETFERLVYETRLFGVPLSVRVITTPTSLQLLEDVGAVDGAAASPEDIARQMAIEWLQNEAIESSEGADDGLLLFVVIPEDDHSQTTAAFAAGTNALPINGVTEERLEGILANDMQPYFASNSIGEGINQGIAMLAYINLFEPSPRIELGTNHQRLQLAANGPLAAITVGSTLGLLGLTAWIRSRRHDTGDLVKEPLSPFEAGAITRGRVDESVTTGALLRLLHKGALIARTTRSGEIAIERGSSMDIPDPFERTMLESLEAQMDESGRMPAAPMRRLQDILMPASRSLEDSLARKGLFNRDGRVETVWVVLGCFATAAVALFTLLPSILGMARFGILSILIALAGILVALVWATRRSFATESGMHARDAWLASSPEIEDLAAYDAIVNQDVLLGIEGGVSPTPQERVVRTLRGVG